MKSIKRIRIKNRKHNLITANLTPDTFNLTSLTFRTTATTLIIPAPQSTTPSATAPVDTTSPTCTTNAATNITYNSAKLNGTVSNPSLEFITFSYYYFDYGTSLSYGISTTATSLPIISINPIPVTANVSSLLSSTLYNFRVVGVNDYGTTYGNNLTFTTLVDITPPPSNLCSISIDNGVFSTSSTNVTLTLSAQDPESSIVQMRFSNNGTDWSDWENYAITKSWTLTEGDGLKTVYVQYKNSAGLVSESLLGSIVLATTSPADPSNLVATATSSSQIYLIWQDNSNNEQGFKIESKVNSWGDFAQIATVGANITSYSTTRVLTGITHYYRVRAYNVIGNSDYSNTASATPTGNLTYDEKVATGTLLIATFRPSDYNSVTIGAVETPEPYVPKIFDNRAYVFEATPGVFNLFYTDSAGQTIQVNRTIYINNTTRAISYGGNTVTTLQEIFGTPDPAPVGDFMSLMLDFPYWLTISMTPVSHLQIQAYMDDFTTDKGRPVETVPDGRPSPPLPPEVGRDRTITEADSSTIDGHSIGALISMGVITATVITPTDSYNCWGWTFTCGSGWMCNAIDVDMVLSDNGYTQITPTASAPAKPGDVIVYRDAQGEVTHTGIVRKVDPATGQPTLVESKWGPWGRYLHPPEIVPADYLPPDGKIEYWRAPATRQAPANSTDPDKERHTLPVG